MNLTRRDCPALQILRLPFLESIEYDDRITIDFLQHLIKNDFTEARRLLSNPALQDAALASTSADFYLLFLKAQGPEVAAGVEALRWVQRGVEPLRDTSVTYVSNSFYETSALATLTELYLKSPEAFLSTIRRS